MPPSLARPGTRSTGSLDAPPRRPAAPGRRRRGRRRGSGDRRRSGERATEPVAVVPVDDPPAGRPTVDPLPLDDPARARPGADRCRGVSTTLLGRWPPRARSTSRSPSRCPATGTGATRLIFDSEDTMSMPAYLLVPTAVPSPGPAVLACHGHGPGRRGWSGSRARGSPHGDYAAAARPARPWSSPRTCGASASAPTGTRPAIYVCDINLVHATLAGWSPLTQNLFDLTRCLDVLAGHELVDPARIGMVGLSLGGTMTLFLAAWDERVAAAVVSGYLSSWAEAHKVPWNMCGSQVLPRAPRPARARRPRGARRPATPAGPDRDRGPDLPARRRDERVN